MFVDAGFVYVEPNVRGSDGYGKAWLHADDGPKRLAVITDIEDAARWARSRFAVAGKAPKVGIFGGSYGGYSVLMGMTMFAGAYDAGVDIVGISDLRTFLRNTAPYRRILRISLSTETPIARRGRACREALADDVRRPHQGSAAHHAGGQRPARPGRRGHTDPRCALERRGAACSLMIFPDEGARRAEARRRDRVLMLGGAIRVLPRSTSGTPRKLRSERRAARAGACRRREAGRGRLTGLAASSAGRGRARQARERTLRDEARGTRPAATAAMSAFVTLSELLRRRHRGLQTRMAALEFDRRARRARVVQLAEELVAHATVEQLVLYPYAEELLGVRDLSLEIERSLDALLGVIGGIEDDAAFAISMARLSAAFERHVDGDEVGLLPMVEALGAPEQIVRMGPDHRGVRARPVVGPDRRALVSARPRRQSRRPRRLEELSATAFPGAGGSPRLSTPYQGNFCGVACWATPSAETQPKPPARRAAAILGHREESAPAALLEAWGVIPATAAQVGPGSRGGGGT